MPSREIKDGEICIYEGMEVDIKGFYTSYGKQYATVSGGTSKSGEPWFYYIATSRDGKNRMNVWARNPEQAKAISTGTAILKDIELIFGNIPVKRWDKAQHKEVDVKDGQGQLIWQNNAPKNATATFEAGSGTIFSTSAMAVSDEELPFN